MKYPDFGPYYDYPTQPVGGSNPYWQCVHCGATDPQINGRLSGHFYGCLYVKMKRKALRPIQPVFGLTEKDIRDRVDWQVSNEETWAYSGLNRAELLTMLLAAKQRQGHYLLSSVQNILGDMISHKMAGKGPRANNVLYHLQKSFTNCRITL
jgi:hypothetical protein